MGGTLESHLKKRFFKIILDSTVLSHGNVYISNILHFLILAYTKEGFGELCWVRKFTKSSF